MSHTIRNVSELGSDEKQTLEDLLGISLRADQQLVIEIRDAAQPGSSVPGSEQGGSIRLPEWCNVYEGLSDEEIGELESAVLKRANLTREFE